MVYPKYHKQIVEELMGGKFVLASDKIYEELKENEAFYASFFKASFNYLLHLKQEYAYLTSHETNETLSRDICIFFAILCYELDKDGRNFLDQIQFSEFTIDAVDEYFANSAYTDLIQANKQLKDKDSRRNLINAMSRKNIIEKTGEDRFMFTNAYKVFIDFAVEVAKSRTEETVIEKAE
jgi:hypothetical protein